MQITVHNPSSLPLVDYRTVKELQGNLKDLSTKNHNKLLRVLQKRGFTTPFFLWNDPEDGGFYILDGHQRQRVMTKNDMNDAGSYMVPYVLVQADNKVQAKEQLLEITSQYGHMTMEGLDEFAFDLDLAELDIHFDALDLDKFLEGLNEEIEEDEAPEVDEANPPVSVLGEVYQLGRHRLMCGDSTKDIEQLMGGAKPDNIVTDPPYGIDWNTDHTRFKGGVAHNRSYSPVANDDQPFDPMPFLELCGNCLFFGANCFSDKLPKGNWIVWDKRFDNGTAFLADAEVAWYNGSGAVYIIHETSQGFVSSDDGRHHPTQKPIKLMGQIINKINAGATILDPFGGSGSTLIACEQLDRTCYMMELDPKYCDVIRKRYAKFVEAEDWEAATPQVEAVSAA